MSFAGVEVAAQSSPATPPPAPLDAPALPPVITGCPALPPVSTGVPAEPPLPPAPEVPLPPLPPLPGTWLFVGAQATNAIGSAQAERATRSPAPRRFGSRRERVDFACKRSCFAMVTRR